ncbi:hypothetical protein GGR56DRAFT_627556 [Xylariaceae sp. FL0804]|nr:hypothetical protein GGR56DRAFT_627556 [Xylariaceae sp. FL0804]
MSVSRVVRPLWPLRPLRHAFTRPLIQQGRLPIAGIVSSRSLASVVDPSSNSTEPLPTQPVQAGELVFPEAPVLSPSEIGEEPPGTPGNEDGVRYPRAVQALYLQPLRRTAEYGVPSCDLQLRSYSIPNLEFFCDFALRAAYYLNLPAFGPVPLPKITERWTVPRSHFIFKKSQENFERVTRRRLIQIRDGHPETVHIWLAFLQKHAYYGLGMKANMWEYSRMDVGKDLDDTTDSLQRTVETTMKYLGRDQTLPTVEKVKELLESEQFRYSKAELLERDIERERAKLAKLERAFEHRRPKSTAASSLGDAMVTSEVLPTVTKEETRQEAEEAVEAAAPAPTSSAPATSAPAPAISAQATPDSDAPVAEAKKETRPESGEAVKEAARSRTTVESDVPATVPEEGTARTGEGKVEEAASASSATGKRPAKSPSDATADATAAKKEETNAVLADSKPPAPTTPRKEETNPKDEGV